MNNLELKHLAPYLPYGIECICHTNYKGGIDTKQSIIAVGESYITYTNTCYQCVDVSFGHIKPILRPLSDLTKQLVDDMTEYSDIEDVVFSGNPSNLYFVNTEDKTYLDDYTNILEMLYKNHYDVFGLIEKGLAIDINTLK